MNETIETMKRRCSRHPWLRAAVAALLLITSAPCTATENDPGAWLVMTTSDVLGGDESRWRYWLDAQARYFDISSGAAQYLLRPAIGYDLGNGMSAWFGYARFRSRTASGIFFDENRFWQQLSWGGTRLGPGVLSLRARLEQRSLSRGDDVGVTLRFMGKYVQPLGQSPRTDLVLAVEPFLDLVDTDWGGRARLSQNRVFAGFGRRLGDSVRLEAGYMNQFFFADSGENRSNHLAIFNFRVSF